MAEIDTNYKYVPDSEITKKLSYRITKKLVDIIIGIIIIILLLPVFAIIILLIKMTSKGPAFYNWNVVGKNGVPFKSWKFRTMVQNADKLKNSLIQNNEMEGPVFKMKNDPRITSIGKILRKYSLDELPQFFSVIKGDMSLVGPRPVLPIEWNNYKSWQERKLSVMPGITCIWQVTGRNEISNFDDWVKLDLKYIDQWSLFLDFKILLMTLPAVIKGTGY